MLTLQEACVAEEAPSEWRKEHDARTEKDATFGGRRVFL